MWNNMVSLKEDTNLDDHLHRYCQRNQTVEVIQELGQDDTLCSVESEMP